jgi:hypothetical protein
MLSKRIHLFNGVVDKKLFARAVKTSKRTQDKDALGALLEYEVKFVELKTS